MTINNSNRLSSSNFQTRLIIFTLLTITEITLFISRETQEQIDQLQSEIKRLKADNAQLNNGVSEMEKRVKSSGKSWMWFTFISIFLLIGSWMWFLFGQQPTVSTEWQLNRGGEVSDWHPDPSDSIIYRVQIGAYQHFGLDSLQNGGDLIKQEISDEWHKISLGGFSTFIEAQAFQEKVVNLGFQNAYITAWKGNEEVGLIQKKQ